MQGFFQAPDNVRQQFPQYPLATNYRGLQRLILQAQAEFS